MYKIDDVVTFTFLNVKKVGKIVRVVDETTYWIRGNDGTLYPAVGTNGSGRWSNIIVDTNVEID